MVNSKVFSIVYYYEDTQFDLLDGCTIMNNSEINGPSIYFRVNVGESEGMTVNQCF
jgi:hypothetical protein